MTSTHLPESTHTIVVGGGAGGCACAAVLARQGDVPVLLLESGPDYGRFADGRWPGDMLNAASVPLSHDYGLRQARAGGPGVLDLPRARILGGCTAHNGCTASLGSRFDYDDWARQGNPSWTTERVLPLLEWVHAAYRVRRYTLAELTPPQRAFVNAGTATGLPFADDLDDINAGEGIGPMPVNIAGAVRWNSAFAFLDPVRALPNLSIAGDVRVDRVDVHAGQVRGVFVTNRDGTGGYVKADRVIVAAGAYHSPALLLNSGIGPVADLAALGVAVTSDLPGVGRHLLDHACVHLDFTGRPGLADEVSSMDWGPDEQTVGRARSSVCDDGPYDIHVFMVAGANSGHPGLPPVSLYGGAMRSRSEGTVTLSRAGEVTTPVIDHRYGTDPDGHDRTVLRESLDLLNRMVSIPELAQMLADRAVIGGGDPLDDIVSYCHPAGTCKMGPGSDRMAVVGDDGHVHGIEGLHVADASIMPSITRGNINLPTAMIGANIAAMLTDTAPADVTRQGTPVRA